MKLSIVIPAYNEARRLPESLGHLERFLKTSRHFSENDVQIVVSDDGSEDDTILVSKEFSKSFSNVEIVSLDVNCGKGAAIRKGISTSIGDWVLIADADMATPWTEIDKFFDYISNENDLGYDVLIGSRALVGSDIRTRQPVVRESMGKIFNFIIRTITGLSFRDTQCGFKLFKGSLAKNLVDFLYVDRFAWDVEFLMKAQLAGAKIIDRPVEWHHREASRVRPIIDSLEMLFATIAMRFNLELNRKQLRSKISNGSQ